METIKKLCTLNLPLKQDTCPSPVTFLRSHEKKCRNNFWVTMSTFT